MKYDHPLTHAGECPSCIAWHAEAQRAALLLETLAADHFPDPAAFDAWITRQVYLTLRASSPSPERPE